MIVQIILWTRTRRWAKQYGPSKEHRPNPIYKWHLTPTEQKILEDF